MKVESLDMKEGSLTVNKYLRSLILFNIYKLLIIKLLTGGGILSSYFFLKLTNLFLSKSLHLLDISYRIETS